MEAAKEYCTLLKLQDIEDFTIFPLYVAVGDGEIDLDKLEAPISYVYTKNGTYCFKDSGVFRTLTPIDEIGGLATGVSQAIYSVNQIPLKMVLEVQGFLHWAYKTFDSEAIVLPYYNPTSGEWLITIPTQVVALGHCDYTDDSDVPDGFVRLGSWHSHGHMSAFHSSVDTDDEEEDSDGFHLTSGDFLKLAGQRPSIVCSMVVNGYRWHIFPGSVLEGVYDTSTIPAKTSWNNKLQRNITTPEHEEFRHVVGKESLEFPSEWKDKVTKRNAIVGFSNGARSSETPKGRAVTYLSINCNRCAFGSYVFEVEKLAKLIPMVLSDPSLKQWQDYAYKVQWYGRKGFHAEKLTEKEWERFKNFSTAVNNAFEHINTKPNSAAAYTISPRVTMQLVRAIKDTTFREEVFKVNQEIQDGKKGVRCTDPNGIYRSEEVTPTNDSLDCAKYTPEFAYQWGYAASMNEVQSLIASFDREMKERETSKIIASDIEDSEVETHYCGECNLFWKTIGFDETGNFVGINWEECPHWANKLEVANIAHKTSDEVITNAMEDSWATECKDYDGPTQEDKDTAADEAAEASGTGRGLLDFSDIEVID